jgi:hypothetical protein
LAPKLSYYFVKKSFADPAIYFRKVEDRLFIKLANDSNVDIVGKIETIFFNLTDNQIIKNDKKDFALKNDERIEDYSLSLKDMPESLNWILVTTLYNEQNYIINRNYFTLKKWKHLKTSASDITINKIGDNNIILGSKTVSLFLDLYYEEARFSDRGFIMLPGEKKDVEIMTEDPEKVNVKDIKIFTLNEYLS